MLAQAVGFIGRIAAMAVAELKLAGARQGMHVAVVAVQASRAQKPDMAAINGNVAQAMGGHIKPGDGRW